MLTAFNAALTEFKLVPSDSTARYYITFSRGDTVSARAFLNANEFVQIKASEYIDLRDEYAACERAWTLYPDLAARPLGYKSSPPWEVMVMEGIQHRPIRLEHMIRTCKPSHPVVAGLHQYFEIGGHKKPAPIADESHMRFFERMASHFAATPHDRLVSHWIEQGRKMGVEGLPRVVQHGDFVQNNLASSNGKLIIFDWEDFEKSFLPGLDLCTLCFSMAQDPAALRAVMDASPGTSTPIAKFAQDACRLLGLDWQLFRRLIPLYLALFLYAKREYSPQLQNRVATLISQLTE